MPLKYGRVETNVYYVRSSQRTHMHTHYLLHKWGWCH